MKEHDDDAWLPVPRFFHDIAYSILYPFFPLFSSPPLLYTHRYRYRSWMPIAIAPGKLQEDVVQKLLLLSALEYEMTPRDTVE